MVIVIVIFIILISLIAYFSSTKMFSFRNISSSDLYKHIECVLYRGANGSFCIITKKKNKQFVQFRKEIVKKGTVNLHFSFPWVKWSSSYFDLVKKMLMTKGIDFTVSEPTNNDPVCFLDANMHDDVEKCTDLVSSIFNDVFQIDSNINYNVKINDISPHEEKIGF